VSDGLRTAVCGPWAAHVASTLRANGVRCAVMDDWQQFQQAMLVKLLWSCVFWLLSAGLGGKPVSRAGEGGGRGGTPGEGGGRSGRACKNVRGGVWCCIIAAGKRQAGEFVGIRVREG
jgi:hypothetical protein